MRKERTRRASRTWLVFNPRDGRSIERALQSDLAPCCPHCDDVLEARSSVSNDSMPDPTTYDLVCGECLRFWRVVRNTARSLRLNRMRRLAAAVRAVDETPARVRGAAASARSG